MTFFKLSRIRTPVTITLALLTLTGCTGLGLAVANAPATFFDGKTHENLVFDDTSHLALDVYIPKQAQDHKLPVIVFFYGGRWSYGEKKDYEFVATALAQTGFVVVVPDYRKYPDVKFPAFVQDGANALQWVHQNIDQYQGDPQQLFIAGHSAGAHIGALLVSDPTYLKQINASDTQQAIKGFAGLAGPYDFTPKAKDLVDMFGPAAQFPQMQVTTFIEGTEPPMLLLTGADDTTVEMYNLDRLQQKIESQNGEVKAIVYDDINHTEIVGAFSAFWRAKAPVLQDVTQFFQELTTLK